MSEPLNEAINVIAELPECLIGGPYKGRVSAKPLSSEVHVYVEVLPYGLRLPGTGEVTGTREIAQGEKQSGVLSTFHLSNGAQTATYTHLFEGWKRDQIVPK